LSRASNYAPRLFALRPDGQAYGEAELAQVMRDLLARDKIKSEPYRLPNRHDGERLVIATKRAKNR
jgi:hypothetical protein